MNTKHLQGAGKMLVAMALMALAQPVFAQGFNAGSDGALGDVIIDANTTIDLPPDGVLHYRSLTVNSGVRLRFNRNARNTPVYILSQSNVVVNGTIDVNGFQAGANNGGFGGPGGFDGGKPAFGSEVPPGNGYGPGGAGGGDQSCNASGAGGGSYGASGGGRAGITYGSPLLIPLVGGSGGGGSIGQPGFGGGGGGGAILIASNTRITVSGRVEARGGPNHLCFNGGSGGAIRLVALKVEGAGEIDVRSNSGGKGRIRVDTIDRSNLNLIFRDSDVTTVGGNLLSFPPVTPTLATIEVAGTATTSPDGGPVTFNLPFGSSPDRTVKIRAQDFGRNVPIRVRLTPDSGTPLTFDAEVDNTTANPAVVEVPVTVPVNTLVTVHAWTR